MEPLQKVWLRYGTPRNIRLFYILITLATLAVAAGAPSAGSGIGSG
jgi:hypothetical protein